MVLEAVSADGIGVMMEAERKIGNFMTVTIAESRREREEGLNLGIESKLEMFQNERLV